MREIINSERIARYCHIDDDYDNDCLLPIPQNYKHIGTVAYFGFL